MGASNEMKHVFRPTQLIPVAAVVEGHRRRMKYGNLAKLANSLEKYGQLQPILVDPLPDGRYRLVAGGRRLRAAGRLGRKQIEAVVRQPLSDPELREIEFEENQQRLDYSDGERAKSFSSSREVTEKAEEFRAAETVKAHNSFKRGRGRPVRATSQRSVAKGMGISKQQLSRAERQVAIVREFPFMEADEWTQGECLAVEERFRRLPVRDHPLVHALYQFASLSKTCSVDSETAADILDGVLRATPEERVELYRLATSEDDRKLDQALLRVVGRGPISDPRKYTYREVVDLLASIVKPYPFDPLTPRIQAQLEEARAILKLLEVPRETPLPESASGLPAIQEHIQ
jgi:hypothetical protein